MRLSTISRPLSVISLVFGGSSLAQDDIVERLNAVPAAERLRAWHDMVASVPHVAGTEGDRHVINELARSFGEMGYDVDIHEIWPLLSYPVSAEVEVMHPTIQAGAGLLPLREVPLAADPYSESTDVPFGFNAYSGSGEATGEVVYANFGRKEDFEKLRELGIDCTGKIVVARYGGNYRGYKAKFAEAAGAAGLLIFLDPGDTGYAKGDVYPRGGWQTDLCIQRGSIVTLPYQGDPLTPFVEATEDAERLDVDEVALPRIPVQPIGWGAARQILVRMEGPEAPADWQGGLPMSYRLTGGPDLRVRVNVQQERRIAKTANVIARMEGALYPDQWVIVGCHHDAWGFGACDPTCGLISLLESARSFAELAATGVRPARTVIFCAWGAEEFGIIGSSEWVEANYDKLREKAVAYINLDMASMGPEFGASASPSLRRLVEDAARLVPQARAAEKTVFEDWLARSPRTDNPGRPSIGDLGGGSDHVGFVCHAGIPGISFGSGGSAGSSYHTAYDN
ncbi:MAG TPA: M28 family peptidase, partial [Phycisphaerales bacterium]|nr:M28 family peptidase [Phycisphaerales bacterium]